MSTVWLHAANLPPFNTSSCAVLERVVMKNRILPSGIPDQIIKTVVPHLFVLIIAGSSASAATPEQIQWGQRLFTQEFKAEPLGENGDGLGPVFNHRSCVACHHSGGVGGAGDHRFNARTFSVSSLRFNGQQTNKSLVQTLKAVAPGLVSSDDSMINSFSIHRRGGSPAFDLMRQRTMAVFNPHWADDAWITSDAVHAEAAPQTISDSTGALSMIAHIHARNTTALFGSGLIDMVPDSVILQQVKTQQRHPEIQGRPATLADGRIGKFGWRANFATLAEFTENACANELGLQSKFLAQPADVTHPSYVNLKRDIENDAIVAMVSFVAALPAPTQSPAQDSNHRNEIAIGEKRFNAIGCSVCHVANLGPAKGIYSDLLLHDMGSSSHDYNEAPPYRKHIEIDYEPVALTSVPYYGKVQRIPIRPDSADRPRRSREFRFEASRRSSHTVKEPVRVGQNDVVTEDISVPLQVKQFSNENLIRVVLQRMSIAVVTPTNVTQEWRTAPLWGLRDSAPYMHDGRAETVLEAISMHDGESQRTRNRFFSLPYENQQAILAFLETFVAPQSGVIPAPIDFTRHHLTAN